MENNKEKIMEEALNSWTSKDGFNTHTEEFKEGFEDGFMLGYLASPKKSDTLDKLINISNEDIEKAYPTRDPNNVGFAYGSPYNIHVQEGIRWAINKIRKQINNSNGR